MKKIVCLLAGLFGFAIFIHAQDMPAWVKMGMTLFQVRQTKRHIKHTVEGI